MPLFFYDATCSFCESASTRLDQLTSGMEIRAASTHSADLPAAVVENIDRFAVYLPGGSADRAELGHRAIGAALRDHGRHRLIRVAGAVLLIRALSLLFAGVYRLIANNRHRIGAAMGLDACAVPKHPR